MNPTSDQIVALDKGDLFEVVKTTPDRIGWLGAIVKATEIRQWGIVGYVHAIIEHGQAGKVYVRLEWADIEKVGHVYNKEGGGNATANT